MLAAMEFGKKLLILGKAINEMTIYSVFVCVSGLVCKGWKRKNKTKSAGSFRNVVTIF